WPSMASGSRPSWSMPPLSPSAFRLPARRLLSGRLLWLALDPVPRASHGTVTPLPRISSSSRRPCPMPIMPRPPDILKRASASHPSGNWNEDDFDVLASGEVVGRIFKVHAAPAGSPWMWTLAFGHHEDRTPTHGYAATREAAMAAFAKSWRRE